MTRWLWVACLLALSPALAHADDLAVVKQQLSDAVRQMKQQAARIDDLQRRVRQLDRQTVVERKVSALPSAPAPPLKTSGEFSVDEVAAQQALDRVLVQQGFAVLPSGSWELEPAFAFLSTESTFPAFIANGGVTTIVQNRLKRYDYVGDLALRIGLPWDSQLNLDVPYRYLDQRTEVTQGGVGKSVRGTGNGGLGDVTVGLDKAIWQEKGWKPNLIAGVQYAANTGGFNHNVPLGNNYNLLRATLTATKAYDPLVFVGQIGLGHGFPAHGFEPGNEYDALVGAVLSVAPESSMRFELEQRFFDYGTRNNSIVPATGRTQSLFITGASVIVAPHTLLDFSVGIGLTSDAPHYYFRVGLPIRFD